jgi:hypothetical protein
MCGCVSIGTECAALLLWVDPQQADDDRLLAQVGHRVIVPYLRGHGSTSLLSSAS